MDAQLATAVGGDDGLADRDGQPGGAGGGLDPSGLGEVARAERGGVEEDGLARAREPHGGGRRAGDDVRRSVALDLTDHARLGPVIVLVVLVVDRPDAGVDDRDGPGGLGVCGDEPSVAREC
jgi:hypothetical protein